jgi:hypothetical protein
MSKDAKPKGFIKEYVLIATLYALLVALSEAKAVLVA